MQKIRIANQNMEHSEEVTRTILFERRGKNATKVGSLYVSNTQR
jgi:hypothetical protein